MNILPIEKQIQVVNALVEGCSIRSTARMVDVEHKTVMRVLLRVGQHCQDVLNSKMWNVQMGNDLKEAFTEVKKAATDAEKVLARIS